MKLIIAITLSLSLSSLSAQDTFQETYGGPEPDFGLSVQETTNGNFICLGGTSSYGAGAQDMYLMKVDAVGNELWSQPIGSENWDFGISVKETTDGGYILCGGYNGLSMDSLVLIRTTVDGDVLWNKRYSGSADRDIGQSVIQTSDDGFIAVGFTGTGFMEDIYLVKTDSEGNEEWSQVYESSGREYAVSIKQLSDDGFIMAGETSSTGAGGKDVFLLRTDALGDTLWTKTYGSNLDEVGRNVQLTDDGGFIIVGYEDFIGGDVFLIKTDGFGNLEWNEEYESDGWDFAHSVKQMPDGGFVVGGRKEDTADNSNHMHCFRTDPLGVIVWETTLPMGFSSDANSIQLTADGGIVILGSSTYFVTSTIVDSDFYLAKINADGTVGLTDDYGLDNAFEVFPNPFSEVLNLDIGFSPSESMTVELIDVFGRLVHTQQVGLSQITRIELSTIESGTYIVLIKKAGKLMASRTIVAQ